MVPTLQLHEQFVPASSRIQGPASPSNPALPYSDPKCRPRSSSPGTEVVVGVNTDISNPSWLGKRALLPDDGLGGSTEIISWAFLWF